MIRRTAGLQPLDSVAMRNLLVSTGVPQTPGTSPVIGALSDLAAAIETFIPDQAASVRQTGAPLVIALGATFSIVDFY